MNLWSAPRRRPEAQGREGLQHRFMTFFLNDRAYGLPLEHVAEITPPSGS
ncbi:MAG: hypothetical protein IPI84_12855 [Holophagaceae bacterium]|nr:hypothetical protein [Holophagaceae bacterium]